MSKTVIQVNNLSKRYRIGLKEKRHDTFAQQIMATLKAPITNFRQLRSMSKFGEEDESVFWALRDINFEVKEGEVLGIIGHNGAGKSTLLKILSRITEPTSGEIKIKGRISALLEVGTGFHPDLTGRENVYMNGTILGMTKREIDAKFDEIVDFSGVEKYIDTPVKFYSSGMKVRLGFAVAAYLEPEVLIIDEVLAVGDIEFQQKCLNKMEVVSESGRTVLFVSHNMQSVKNLCKKGIVLQAGKMVFNGNIQDTVSTYLDVYKKENLIDGIIPFHYSTINTGEAKFKRLTLLNEDGLPTNFLKLYQHIHLHLDIEVFQKINNGMIDIKIISEDGTEIVHSMNLYDNYILHLEQGNHRLHIKINNTLQPGQYCFTVGVHHSNGYTIDYVESIHAFEVQMYSEKNQMVLRKELFHGYVQASAQWILVE